VRAVPFALWKSYWKLGCGCEDVAKHDALMPGSGWGFIQCGGCNTSGGKMSWRSGAHIPPLSCRFPAPLETVPNPAKPLGHKAYGSIGHLPQSRLGPGDHCVPEGQARICLERERRGDLIVVEEKADGSNCSVARINGNLVALTRAGYTADSSPFEQHHIFSRWVSSEAARFDALLDEGERVSGEWLCQAHGTIYDSRHPGFAPFIAFDILRGHTRLTVEERNVRLLAAGLVVPRQIHCGGSFSLESLKLVLEPSGHGAESVEGAVYRVEHKGAVDYLAKWVRPDKVDGTYLPELSGGAAVWNWLPGTED
jgi:hypothetical protein